uniref:Cytochrome c biogenesis protein CcsA n=1 Tax=Polysiphonia sp. TaxID=1967842 RepID=A0A1Z1MT70_9FLOR|nr:cytochrome c biogenesis protein ccs1 [Polysiphonia sp.]
MNINLIETNLINISFGLSLIGLTIYWLNLTINASNKVSYLCTLVTAAINLLLASSLIIRWICNKYFPLSNLYESLIFLGWCITSIQILLEKKTKNKLIGAITTPVVLLIIAFTSISLPNDLKTATPLVPALKSNWLMMHVSIMILSYSTLIIGSLLSILFLIISSKKIINIQGNSNNSLGKFSFKYKINNKISTNLSIYDSKNMHINRINLMQSLDNLSYRIIGLGFPLLTIGIISGAVWANDAWGTYWSWDPKETWALITWITFAIYLHSRLSKTIDGKKPAIIASLGFIIIWICYLGVNFLGKGLHSYGWIL